MDLRDHLNSETSAFVDRLLAVSEAATEQVRADAARQVAAVRTQADEQLAAARAETDGLRSRLEALEAEAGRTARLREADADALRKLQAEIAETELASQRLLDGISREAETLRADAEAARAESQTLGAELEKLRNEADALRADGQTQRSEVNRLLAEAEAARAESHALGAEIEAARAEAEAFRRQSHTLSSEADTVRAQAETFGAEVEALRSESKALRAQIETLRAEADAHRLEAEAVRAESEAHRLEADTLRTKAESLHIETVALRADDSRLRTEALTAAAELHRVQEHLEALRVTEQIQRDHTHRVETRVAELEATVATLGTELDDANELTDATHAELSAIRVTNRRLSTILSGSVAALDALAGATTVGEVFIRLVSQLAGEFDRAAIFRLNGRHLQGDVAVGIDDSVDLPQMVIPVDGSSLVSRAARGTLEHAAGKEIADARPPFGGTPVLAIAAPLLFQGETLAVVYTDADGPVTDGHAPFAGMLVRHANLLLSRLTQELKAARELRDYAQMLLREAEQMLVADIEAGRSDHDRGRRLRDTIDCARQLYAQRAALEGPFAADLLEQQIAAILEEDPSRPFAIELADLVQDRRSHRTAAK